MTPLDCRPSYYLDELSCESHDKLTVPSLILFDAVGPAQLIGLAQRSKCFSQFGTEKFRLFPGGKVPALVHLVVVDEIRVGRLRPAPRPPTNAHHARLTSPPGTAISVWPLAGPLLGWEVLT